MNLNIVPIEYDKRGLEEIVRIIHDAFPDFFDKFILKNPPDKSVYETFLNEISDNKSLYFLNKDLINLLDIYEKPVIGITSYLSVRNIDTHAKYQGTIGASSERGSCFVSIHSPPLCNCDGASRRIGIKCIHELGHMFGLEHHTNCKEIPERNSICPMEIGHRIFREQKKISLADYFDARMTEFCDECYKHLKNLPQPINQFF